MCVKLPDRLAALLALWKHKVPGTADIDARRQVLFGPHSWFFILAGRRWLPEHGIGQAPYIAPERSQAALARIAEIRKAAVSQSPSMRGGRERAAPLGRHP